MTDPRLAIVPEGELYRVGRAPDPLAWPDLERVGRGRFDDPRSEFRVLYSAERRLAALAEVLARWRSGLATPLANNAVPNGWFTRRRLACFRVSSSRGPFLDLGALESLVALRAELAGTLVGLGYPDFDAGEAIGRDRRVTQTIARWAYEEGFGGIRYPSRFDPALPLWAIFEGGTFAEATVSAIAPDDPDLLAVAALFRLTIEQP